MKKLLILFVSLLIAGCAQPKQEQAQDPAAGPQGLTDSSQQKEQSEESPDETFSSFSLSGYSKGGKKQWDLEGRSADIMTGEIKLTDVTAMVYGKNMTMTIVADKGSLNRIDNNVHLEQNVKATTDDGATLTTDYLDWDAENQKLSNDAPAWIRRGTMQAQGTGIFGQPTLNLVHLKKDVTVKIFLQDNLSQSPGTVITCDGALEVEYQNNLAVFQDNVHVKDNRGDIFADKMDVYFSTDSEASKQMEGMEGMGIEKIVAVGFVEIHHGSNISYSEKAVYDTDTGRLTLTGQPKLVIYSTEAFAQLMGEGKGQE